MPEPATEPRRTRRLAWAVVAITLALVGLVPALLQPRPHDFGQYYMGGLMARRADFASLYPTPNPDAIHNPGYKWASTMKPAYAAAANESGVGDDSRYIQPPPVSVALIPLSWLPFRIAYPAWCVLMSVCLTGCIALAERLYRRLSSEISCPRTATWLLAAMAMSPLAYRVLRTGQISPLVALGVGGTVVGVVSSRPIVSALSAVVGGLTKGATVALAPLLFLAGRPSRLTPLIALLLAAAAAIGLTLPYTGAAVWREYFTHIAPLLDRTDDWAGNQGLWGLLLRTGHATGQTDFTLLRVALWLAVAAFTAIAVVRRLPLLLSAPALAYLGLSALLISAPIAWEHYMVYFWPLWGWVYFEAQSGPWWKRTAAFASMALQWAPICVMTHLPEPLNSHMLWAMLLGSLVAGWRLTASAPSPSASAPASDSNS